MYFKDITIQIKDQRKNKRITPLEWQEYAALSTLRLNPKRNSTMALRQDKEFGRTPKMPLGEVGAPDFRDFTNQYDLPSTLKHQVHANLGEIQSASLESDSQGKFNVSLNRRAQDLGSEEFPHMANCIPVSK